MSTVHLAGGTVELDGFVDAHPDDVTPSTRTPSDWLILADAVPPSTATLEVLVRIGLDLDELLERAELGGRCGDLVRASRRKIAEAVAANVRGR